MSHFGLNLAGQSECQTIRMSAIPIPVSSLPYYCVLSYPSYETIPCKANSSIHPQNIIFHYYKQSDTRQQWVCFHLFCRQEHTGGAINTNNTNSIYLQIVTEIHGCKYFH